jgi:tRNA A-37 threonylcarbamoyl transferase component Bud32
MNPLADAVALRFSCRLVHGDLTTSNLMLVPKPDDPIGAMVWQQQF